MPVIVAFLLAISLSYLSSNHKVTFVILEATYLKFSPNRGWHGLIPAGGTFISLLSVGTDNKKLFNILATIFHMYAEVKAVNHDTDLDSIVGIRNYHSHLLAQHGKKG